jgi:hypothetical protein
MSKQPVKQGCASASDMQITCGTRSKANPNLFAREHLHTSPENKAYHQDWMTPSL